MESTGSARTCTRTQYSTEESGLLVAKNEGNLTGSTVEINNLIKKEEGDEETGCGIVLREVNILPTNVFL